MADPTIIDQSVIDNWKKLNNELEKAEGRLKNLRNTGAGSSQIRDAVQAYKNAGEELNRYYDKLTDVQREVVRTQVGNDEFNASAQRLAANSSRAGGSLQKFRDQSELAGRAIVGVATAAAIFGTKIGSSIVDPTKNARDALRDMPDIVSKMAGMFGITSLQGDKLKNAVLSLNEVSRNARGIWVDLSDAQLGFGKSIGQTREQTIAYIKTTQGLSSALGFQADTFRQVMQSAAEVPDAVNRMTSSNLQAARSGKDLTGLMLVMRGASLDAAKAGDTLASRYKEFGEKTAVQVSRQLGIMATASRDVGVHMKIAQDQIVSASAPLAIFGRKSGEASRAWKTFMQALGDQMPIKQVSGLLRDLTNSIANMNLENRAFLSMLSGFGRGMGALTGGLRMELMLRREGGLERNIESLVRAISRFGGGQVITLQQAAEAPGLAMQFEVQRRLVGQMTGMQGQQAARMLEVLQRVQQGGMSQLDASKAVAQLTRDGEQRQKEGNTMMDRVAQYTKQTAELTKAVLDTETKALVHIETMSKGMVRTSGRNPLMDTRRMGRFVSGLGGAFKEVGSGVMEEGGNLIKAIKSLTEGIHQISDDHERQMDPVEPMVDPLQPRRRIEMRQRRDVPMPGSTVPVDRARHFLGGNANIVPTTVFGARAPSTLARVTAKRDRTDEFLRNNAALASVPGTLGDGATPVPRTSDHSRTPSTIRGARNAIGPAEPQDLGTIKVAVVCEHCSGKIAQQTHKIQQYNMGIDNATT